MDSILAVGSILFTIRICFILIVSNLAGFSIDNKMIKILYNVDKLDHDGNAIKS